MNRYNHIIPENNRLQSILPLYAKSSGYRMLAFCLMLSFLILSCVCLPDKAVAATESPIWFERKTRSMAAMMRAASKKASKEAKHPGKKTEKKMGHPAATPSAGHGADKSAAHASHKSAKPAAPGHASEKKTAHGKKKKKKTRAPMSRPASYLLKTGSFPYEEQSPEALLQSVCWLQKPDKTYNRLAPRMTKDGILVFDDARQAGLYQLHLYYDAGVQDSTRFRHFSSLWFRNTGDEEFTEKTPDITDLEGLHEGNPLFYLQELTKDNENNFVSQKRDTGDIIPFRVLFRGKPVPGVPVTMTTKQGWEKTQITDENGQVSFLLIKEIFHNKKVYKRPEPYLVKAVYKRPHKASVNGTPYETEVCTATIRLRVYPTPYDWKSKSAGFFVFAGSALAVAFGAAIRRKRSLAI